MRFLHVVREVVLQNEGTMAHDTHESPRAGVGELVADQVAAEGETAPADAALMNTVPEVHAHVELDVAAVPERFPAHRTRRRGCGIAGVRVQSGGGQFQGRSRLPRSGRFRGDGPRQGVGFEGKEGGGRQRFGWKEENSSQSAIEREQMYARISQYARVSIIPSDRTAAQYENRS